MDVSRFLPSEVRNLERNGTRKYDKSEFPRLRWTDELHLQFVDVVESLGGRDKATPKRILQMMNANGLKISHVKSHLQMYRSMKEKTKLRRKTRFCDDFSSISSSHRKVENGMRKWVDLNEEISSKNSQESSSSKQCSCFNQNQVLVRSMEDSNSSSNSSKKEEDNLSLSLNPPLMKASVGDDNLPPSNSFSFLLKMQEFQSLHTTPINLDLTIS